MHHASEKLRTILKIFPRLQHIIAMSNNINFSKLIDRYSIESHLVIMQHFKN